MAKELLKGNVALAEASIRAGVEAYFGYPITPQTEILEHFAYRLPELGRAFVQAESEVAAINMVYGAACTGKRVMTTSSSPGVSLMMEGLSYIAGTEVPVVIANVMRGGPGLGNIAPAQGDYKQMVHGGGHGDYKQIVLAPSSVQETIDLTVLAFDLAEKYRMIAVILTDGSLGQMMEPAELPEMQPLKTDEPEWAITGAKGRDRRVLSSIYIDPVEEEETNIRLMKRWMEVEKNEIRYQEYFLDDAEHVLVGFGTAGRVALSAVREARDKGIKVGLIRPITLSPFPIERIREISKKAKNMLVVEMNSGQMLDDVRMSVGPDYPVAFYGRMGGVVPLPEEVLLEIEHLNEHGTPAFENTREEWLERLEAVRGGN